MKCFRNKLFTEEYIAEDNTSVFYLVLKILLSAFPK